MNTTLEEGRTRKSKRARARSEGLMRRFREVRSFSEELCAPLSPEDCVVQSMPDASPAKWHLAHTSWFFETFVLEPRKGYAHFSPEFRVLYNSYYNAVGAQHPRPQRGLITRPALDEVLRYRSHVDRHVLDVLEEGSPSNELLDIMEIGLQHEQQHQELILMDIKHLLSCNPLKPSYKEVAPLGTSNPIDMSWIDVEGGLVWIGHEGPAFAYDNEGPRHQTCLRPFRIGSRLVTNAEFLEFIRDGGYRQPEWWLSEGWSTVQERGWEAPGYWQELEGEWMEFTLGGLRALHLPSPVAHVSYFEADAYARWAGFRLATEAEWETAARTVSREGNFVEDGYLHPVPSSGTPGLQQMFGDLWEWTRSHYSPYPGYQATEGALGEYNGKFMCNQFVLRGGCCATSRTHIRATYRNFFPAQARWVFGGIRLARDV